MRFLQYKKIGSVATILLALLLSACQQPQQQQTGGQQTPQQAANQQPVITAAPVAEGEAPWQVTTGESVTLTVTAPGAQRVRLFYRPIVVENRHIEIGALDAPTDAASGKFSTELRPPADFAGHVWAAVFYQDGTRQETEPLALATRGASAAGRQQSNDAVAGQDARSDRLTGGRIQQTELQPGQGDIRITVNLPAFRLTLWQDGREVKTYEIGIGRQEFPVPTGQREINEIIFNPEWIPPDSSWVRESGDVEPGERIPAEDPRNPLGKIKIPLGNAYLIHEAAAPSDIGRLVSHGCIRMRTDDLFDLAEKIIAARGLQLSRQDIRRVRETTERRTASLNEPLPIDISYDTQVIEGGALRLYPDVYDRDTNTVENVREELQAVSPEAANIEEQTLRQMLERVSRNEIFVVRVADLRSGGQALAAGRNEPLTSQQAQGQNPQRRGNNNQRSARPE